MPADWDQAQTSIWLQKCKSNPEFFEIDNDHTKCKCCGTVKPTTKRKSRKKEGRK